MLRPTNCSELLESISVLQGHSLLFQSLFFRGWLRLPARMPLLNSQTPYIVTVPYIGTSETILALQRSNTKKKKKKRGQI